MRVSALTAISWLLAGFASRQAATQSHLGIEVATAHYGGSARDTIGTPHAHPGQATTFGIRFDQTVGHVRVGLRLSYGKPGFSLSGEGLTITDRSAGQLIESAGFLSFRVGGIGPSGAIRAALGPALHLWKFGDEIRMRVGAISNVSYEWPIAGRFLGAVNLEGILSKSWFDAADLPPEYERQVTWRYGVGLALRYRL